MMATWRSTGIAVASGLAVATLLLGGCRDYRVQEVAPLPPRVEVEGPDYLRVQVVDMAKQPLAASELPTLQRAGVRWEYKVQFTNSGSTGVRLDEVQDRLRSLTGVATTSATKLPPSRVEPGGTTPITVRATLSSSDVQQKAELQGIQELTFKGQDDGGKPVQVVVRVPLS
jgi:hypothetical protein